MIRWDSSPEELAEWQKRRKKMVKEPMHVMWGRALSGIAAREKAVRRQSVQPKPQKKSKKR